MKPPVREVQVVSSLSTGFFAGSPVRSSFLPRAVRLPLLTTVLLATLCVEAVPAVDFLEIGIERHESPNAEILHTVYFQANQDGASACDLLTPSGTYALIDLGGEFQPGTDYFSDHVGLTFPELEAAIDTPWQITFDAGPSQTVATVDFGTVADSDFLLLPTIIIPVDGVPIEIPGDPNPPTMEWGYGSVPPCEAQLDYVRAFVANGEGVEFSSDELSCEATSWTPTSPLAEGSWFLMVQNNIATRFVPDGIDVLEGAWGLENLDWLDLSSIDVSSNAVVPTVRLSWGGVKAHYR